MTSLKEQSNPKDWKKIWLRICGTIDVKGKTIKEVQAMCIANAAPTHHEIAKVKEGWIGKPKGMRQICWERGLLDPQKKYVAKRTKRDTEEGGRIEYREVLDRCFDFQNELTMLIHLGNNLGVEVDRSTKCHPELAGEGIAYTWGRAKGLYRRARLGEKEERRAFTIWARDACRRTPVHWQRVDVSHPSCFGSFLAERDSIFLRIVIWKMVALLTWRGGGSWAGRAANWETEENLDFDEKFINFAVKSTNNK
jgi:hypothetical protein